MNIWLILLATGLITYGIRLSLIILYGKHEMPARLQQALRYVPPAVLSAIIFPEVLLPGGNLNISLANPRLLAAVLAAWVAWRTKNVVLTIVVGMVTLLVVQTFFLGSLD
jgi:branched-subunit amino acid transport protein